MSTVGDFLVEKFENMHRWLVMDCEGYDKDKYESFRSMLTPTNVTLVAEVLLRNKTAVYRRDWYVVMTIKGLPAEIVELAALIRPQSALHDKFWRYLELFVESVSSD